MSGCRNNKIKCNCGSRQNAKCVDYDGYLPAYSVLEDDCVNIEETTEELYKNQEKILDSIDLTKLGKDCLDYSEFQETDTLKVREALLTIEKEICEIKSISSSTDICGGDTSLIGLDFKCLVTPCGTSIDTLNQLLQVIIDKLCDLDTRLKILETNG